MAVVCPICREVVHVSCGYIVRHGYTVHSVFKTCAGSGSSYMSICDSCG